MGCLETLPTLCPDQFLWYVAPEIGLLSVHYIWGECDLEPKASHLQHKHQESTPDIIMTD